MRRELDMQIRIFKELIDKEDNKNEADSKKMQKNNQSYRFKQELAAMMLLIRIFYVKLE